MAISRSNALMVAVCGAVLAWAAAPVSAQSVYFDRGRIVEVCAQGGSDTARGDDHEDESRKPRRRGRKGDRKRNRNRDRERDRGARTDCVKVVQGSVKRVRERDLPDEMFNSQLGQVAAALLRSVQERGEKDRKARDIALAMRFLARRSTDESQRRSFLELARMIARGEIDLMDLELPFAVSPS